MPLLPDFLNALAVLAVLLAAVLLAAWLLRRAGWARPRGAGRLAIIEALPLDPRRRLLLLRCDDRCALVLTGGPTDLMLGWLPEPRLQSAESAP